MGSDSRNELQNGDYFPSIFVVENEEIRTTSFSSCDHIDSLSYVNAQENRVSCSEDDLFHHQLNGIFVELEPKFTGFCNGNVSETSGSVHNPNYFFVESGCKMALSSCMACDNREQCQKSSHMQSLQHSFAGKKRKMASYDESQLPASKNASNIRNKNELAEKQGEEKLELEQKSVAKRCVKIVGKECRHSSNDEAAPNAIILPKVSTEASKEDHVQLGAKRGHATSKHNLAERIRRERINERMRFLQGLVPGCDKMTGKAVMLDEIINYILSLQHQVEFLSTKLDAVKLREKSQPDHFLSNDIYHSRGIFEATADNHEVSSFHSVPNNYACSNSSNEPQLEQRGSIV